MEVGALELKQGTVLGPSSCRAHHSMHRMYGHCPLISVTCSSPAAGPTVTGLTLHSCNRIKTLRELAVAVKGLNQKLLAEKQGDGTLLCFM